MADLWKLLQILLEQSRSQWLQLLDIGLILLLFYLFLSLIGDRRTLRMVRGLLLLVLAAAISIRIKLYLVGMVLSSLAIAAAASLAFMHQSELRLFLEQLGRGELDRLFQPTHQQPPPRPDSAIEELVDAVKELSQNRIGALIVVETFAAIDDRSFSDPGVRLNAEVSKELLQTIFQPKTLLHDGAVLIRESWIVAAGVILPLSERPTSRQLGTRHRAAMGITERVENCVCVVVSEETGSISLAERGELKRPLTSSKLKELLESRFSQSVERELAPVRLQRLTSLMLMLRTTMIRWVSCLFRRPPSASEKRK